MYLSARSVFVVKNKSMKIIRLYILLLSFLTINNSLAQEIKENPVKDPVKLIEQVNLLSKTTNSITADFIQEKEMSFMEEKVISSGRFYFQKDNLLRWEYTEPFKYAIILNGERIRIIDEGKSKDFDTGSNRMFLQITEVMTGMVNGTLLNSSKFTTSWYDAPDFYKAELVPTEKSLQEYLQQIELKINKQDYSVEELKMFERSGDYTQISFHNKKLNEIIPAEIFNLD